MFGGPAGEELFFGPADDDSDFIDQLMARRYLCGCFANNQIELQMLRMSQAAERLVTSSRREIEIIAAALMRQGTLSGDAVIELLNGATPSASWVHHAQGGTINEQRSVAEDANILILLPLSGHNGPGR